MTWHDDIEQMEADDRAALRFWDNPEDQHEIVHDLQGDPMAFKLIDPAGEYTTDEKAVVLTDKSVDDTRRLYIHPWDRPDFTNPREVYVMVGWLDENGEALLDKDGDSQKMENIIVNREDFVDAILAAFPELSRAPHAAV